jgi:hypothetical protein
VGPKTSTLSFYEKEYLAILLVVEHWRPYLQLKEFIIRAYHKSLTNLNEQRLRTDWQHKALTKLMGLQYKIQYKKGCDNGATDALPRQVHESCHLLAVSSVQPVWLQDIVSSYTDDSKAQSLLQKLAASPQNSDGVYTLSHGLLLVHGKIWVGNVPSLDSKFFTAFHASPLCGHSGFRIRSLFRWVGMRQYIKSQVQSCFTCQQAKPERVNYPGLLQPLLVPQGAWQVVSMDFIEGLPQSGSFNCIIVFMDTFTKYAQFVPLRLPFTALEIAEVFLNTIYKLYSMPIQLVSDCDKIFTSRFWQEVLSRTSTQLTMSTSYRP